MRRSALCHPSLISDKLFLLRFLKIYDFNVNKAKDLLVLNLEMRKKNPILFGNRDVLSDAFQQTFRIMQICPIKNTVENHKVTCFRLVDADPDKYVYSDVCRTVVSMLDVRFVTVDDNELIDGEIGVIDMTGFTFKHVLKSAMNLSLVKSYMKYVQEGAPFKIVQNHFINCPPIMDKFLALIKPFLKKEVLDTIKFHSSLESLYDTVSRDLLPNEFGGTAGSMVDINNAWIKKVESKRWVEIIGFLFPFSRLLLIESI